MNIWFGTTTLHYVTYKKYYFAIRNYLIESGCVLTDDWLRDYGKWIESNLTAKRNVQNLYRKCVTAMDASEAAVIEFTVPNFSSSHQINYCVTRKKPTLVLRLKKDNTFADSYIEGMKSPFLIVKTYTLRTYKATIDEFLGYSQIEPGFSRYNIVLNNKQKYYLDWASARYKKSRSEIIRDQVDELINDDSDFKKYMALE